MFNMELRRKKMNSIVKQNNRKAAFTIVELLTVMSIIVILIGLMVPALNKVKRYARDVNQKAQFRSMEAAIELFNSEYDRYPPSDALDIDGADYCGAMKLAEAMMGQDLMGFHPDSLFKSDGGALYGAATVKDRKGALLPLENANAYRFGSLYDDPGPYELGLFVLCDVYNRVTNKDTGKRVGMPILYYKADTSKSTHNINDENDPENIYNYLDNYELVSLGFPGKALPPGGPSHELADDPKRFYLNTKNYKISLDMPFKEDSYILISAGWDGEYGTADDICNFDWKYMSGPVVPVP